MIWYGSTTVVEYLLQYLFILKIFNRFKEAWNCAFYCTGDLNNRFSIALSLTLRLSHINHLHEMRGAHTKSIFSFFFFSFIYSFFLLCFEKNDCNSFDLHDCSMRTNYIFFYIDWAIKCCNIWSWKSCFITFNTVEVIFFMLSIWIVFMMYNVLNNILKWRNKIIRSWIFRGKNWRKQSSIKVERKVWTHCFGIMLNDLKKYFFFTFQFWIDFLSQ